MIRKPGNSAGIPGPSGRLPVVRQLSSGTAVSIQLSAEPCATQTGWSLAATCYARVMMDIVEDGSRIRSGLHFLDPFFGRRLAFACAGFVLLLGSYLVGVERAASILIPLRNGDHY